MCDLSSLLLFYKLHDFFYNLILCIIIITIMNICKGIVIFNRMDMSSKWIF